MKANDTLAGFNPIVNLVFFTAVIGLSMFLMNPASLCVSFVCAAMYSIYLLGVKAVKAGLKYTLPMMILTAAVNPLFNHQGVIILAYLPNGNPLTLESLLFGIAAAVMIASVITWFSCFNAIMTSDKFVYLFGRAAPALSLLLSMSLRFVPRFKAQIKVISHAQKGIGRDVSSCSLYQRARQGIKILSIMITWALENSIETADSMTARGYGLKKRTSFLIFRFTRRDFYALVYILMCVGIVAFCTISGAYNFRYFPSIKGSGSIFAFTAHFLLAVFPVAVNLKEDFTWKYIKSKT